MTHIILLLTLFEQHLGKQPTRGLTFLMFSSLIGFILSNLIYFALHISSSGSFPHPLSADEERECLERAANGDENARNKLIEHNLRLVAHIIKKYYSSYNDQDDLISIGTIGLIKAVSTFDHTKGTRLGTYASTCIENEIKMYFRSMKKYSQDVYISDPIDFDSEGNPLTLLDILTGGENLDEELEKKVRIEALTCYISEITDEREKKILTLRYGLNNSEPLTQREVATILGISRSYVSRIEKKALQRLYSKFSH